MAPTSPEEEDKTGLEISFSTDRLPQEGQAGAPLENERSNFSNLFRHSLHSYS